MDGIGDACDCNGAEVFGLCWYLGNAGQTCDQACASRGGFDATSSAYVGGTGQGGSVAECGAVLTALGHAAPAGASTRGDGVGLGCHVWSGTSYWLRDDTFGPDQSMPPASIACACND